MNRDALVTAISEKTGFTKCDSRSFLDAFIDTVTEGLKNNKSIMLQGFGAFKVQTRAEKKTTNPRTHEEMIIPETKVVKFQNGKQLKELINSDDL